MLLEIKSHSKTYGTGAKSTRAIGVRQR